MLVLLGGVTAVTKLESLKYVEWAHSTELECVCASYPPFFICYFTNEESKEKQGAALSYDFAFWFHECGCCACEFRAPGWIGLGDMPQYVFAYFVATDSVLGLDQTAVPPVGCQTILPGQELHFGLFFDLRKRCASNLGFP